ncbi:uncharacterized protein [Watersipora subatra]|uniref:uncharacterized protein n=1 Tax=Watersipora subatra TaxID=2589382 RepID=UPI00355B37F4
MASFLSLAVSLAVIKVVEGSHFMGGSIRFKTDPSQANTATFYWKASWRIGRGPCSSSTCTEDDVGSYGTNFDSSSNGGNEFKCHAGCSDANDLVVFAGPEYWITAVNTVDDYEMGENEFTHTFASAGPFNVG